MTLHHQPQARDQPQLNEAMCDNAGLRTTAVNRYNCPACTMGAYKAATEAIKLVKFTVRVMHGY